MAVLSHSEFERLFDEQAYRAAWRLASRLCATREDAEDLLQEALLLACRKLPQLRQEDAFRAWLLAIIRRVWLSSRRRGQVPLVDSLLFQDYMGETGEEPLSHALASALAGLPAAQQEVLALSYFDGLSLAELGRVLGISASSANQRLYRARLALARRLKAGCPLPLAEVQR